MLRCSLELSLSIFFGLVGKMGYVCAGAFYIQQWENLMLLWRQAYVFWPAKYPILSVLSAGIMRGNILQTSWEKCCTECLIFVFLSSVQVRYFQPGFWQFYANFGNFWLIFDQFLALKNSIHPKSLMKLHQQQSFYHIIYNRRGCVRSS